MGRDIHTEEMDRLVDAVVGIDNREDAYRFFDDLCTATELDAIAQRFAVSCMLLDKKTYQEISSKTGASTATISRVNRTMQYGGGGFEVGYNIVTNQESK